jgi:hypothetical protein
MKLIKAPEQYKLFSIPRPMIFLAGSIEMGKAEDWQSKVIDKLLNYDCTIFSPRRDNWDSSWEQSADNPKLNEQIKWELEQLSLADIILMHFDPNTKSPITLLEFGLYAKYEGDPFKHKLIVNCPDGFWRKANIIVTANEYNVILASSLDDLIEKGIERIKGFEK